MKRNTYQVTAAPVLMLQVRSPVGQLVQEVVGPVE